MNDSFEPYHRFYQLTHERTYFVDRWNWLPINLVRYGSWRVFSFGPDFEIGPYAPYSDGYNYTVLYDPTNGAVSGGDIMRSQINPEGYNLISE